MYKSQYNNYRVDGKLQRMIVRIIAAITADGFIARGPEHAADWTSKEDKRLFVELTKKAGVMIMGSRTYDTIGRPLPGRKTVVYTSRPENYDNPELLVTSAKPSEILNDLKEQGYSDVAICGGAQIYDLFLQSGLVTDLHLTVEPILFGQGTPLLAGSTDIEMTLHESKLLNENTIALHYKIA